MYILYSASSYLIQIRDATSLEKWRHDIKNNQNVEKYENLVNMVPDLETQSGYVVILFTILVRSLFSVDLQIITHSGLNIR